MARPEAERLTPLELEIMNVLWRLDNANVQAVQQALPRELAYTTVQPVLNILQRKGKVTRAKRDRAYFYTPMFIQSQVARHAVSDMVEPLFRGAARSLGMTMLYSRHLTPQQLD